MSGKYDKDGFKLAPISARQIDDHRKTSSRVWVYEIRGGLEVYTDSSDNIICAFIPSRVMREFLRVEDSR